MEDPTTLPSLSFDSFRNPQYLRYKYNRRHQEVIRSVTYSPSSPRRRKSPKRGLDEQGGSTCGTRPLLRAGDHLCDTNDVGVLGSAFSTISLASV